MVINALSGTMASFFQSFEERDIVHQPGSAEGGDPVIVSECCKIAFEGAAYCVCAYCWGCFKVHGVVVKVYC
jgi:hypothetical protein